MSIRIPKCLITKENISTLEKKLYIQKEKIDPRKKTFYIPEKHPFYEIFDDYISIPFTFGKNYFGRQYINEEFPKIEYTFHGKLREEQEGIKTKALEQLHEHNSVLCSVYPGGGKTITSLNIIKELQLKVLIIVNKLVLVQQWKESIKKFLGIDPFVITGKNCKIKNAQIYIINAQNVCKHHYDRLNIGVVVVDEAHLILSLVFSKGLFHISPKYLLALSASPWRTDGFDALFDLFFGVHRIHIPLFRKHNVEQIYTSTIIENKVQKNGQMDWNSVIQNQIECKARNELIVQKCLEHKNRNILVLTKRIQQMKQLEQMIKERDPEENVTVFKENDVTFDEDCRIFISSYQKVGTGFSFDKLDMLILGCDIKEFFYQYLGRIFRKPEKENQELPLVIDIVDRHPVLYRHATERKKIFLDCGGEIKKIRK